MAGVMLVHSGDGGKSSGVVSKWLKNNNARSALLKSIPQSNHTATMSSSSIIRQAALLAVLLLLSYTPSAQSFITSHVPKTTPQTTSTSINIFGGLKGAFANDESLGEAKNAGLSNGPKYNEQVTVNGKAVPRVVVDQKISNVCNAARVKVPYNCQNGECGTCMVKINGRKMKACVSKVPAGKCAIETL